MKRLAMLLMVVGLMLAMALPATAKHKANHPEKPVDVWICHFAGHDDATPEDGLDGDYVIKAGNIVDGEPKAASVDGCLARGGNGVIELSSRGAVRGHDVQLADRIDGYR